MFPIHGPCVLGLQLMGVYALILYHIWPSEFGNGFMGVDLLFVVFGFLTGTKLIELSNNGWHETEGAEDNVPHGILSTFDKKRSNNFYGKMLVQFAQQIRCFYLHEFAHFVPLNLLLIVGSIIAAFVLFLDDATEQLREDILWALFFGTNHQLSDVDWTMELIGVSLQRPLFHLWAIAVQMQFLLAFSPPLLLLVRLASGTKCAHLNVQLVQLLALFVLLIIPSFFFWIFVPSKSAMMGWTFARAWQCLLGTMAAFIANPTKGQEQMPTTKINEAKSALKNDKSLPLSTIAEHCLFCLVAVCLGLVFFLPSAFWPPLFQLKTVLAIAICVITAFLLGFFTSRLKKSVPPCPLSRWLFLHFSQFPFICFLLHQPLAVFFRAFLIVNQLNIFEGICALLLISLCPLFLQTISHAIFAFVPPKKCPFSSSSLFVYFLFFGYAFCLLFAIAPGPIRLSQQHQNALSVPIFDESQHNVQFLALNVHSVRKLLEQIQTEAHQTELSPLLTSGAQVKINEMLKNSFTFDCDVPGEAVDDFVRENQMVEDNRHVKRIYEWRIKGNGTNGVMLFGNSHAQVAWRELEMAFGGNFSWLHVVSVPGCMPLYENDWRTIYGIHCAQIVKGLLKLVEKRRPDLLFLIFRWYDDFQLEQQQRAAAAGEADDPVADSTEFGQMQSLMDKLQLSVSTRIFISAPNLQFDTDISHQLAKRIWQNASLEGLNKKHSKHLEENRANYERLARLRCAKCAVFDLADEFCWKGMCHAFEQGTKLAYFSDRNHLSFLGRLKARKAFERLATGKSDGRGTVNEWNGMNGNTTDP